MSLLTTEKLYAPSLELLTRVKKSLGQAAVSRRITPAETLPSTSPEILERIDSIKQLPIEDVDIRLAGLIALSRDEDLVVNTAEIPAVLTEAIQDTAEQMVQHWDTDQYNLAAVTSLTEAFAITHDETLIEKAAEVIDTKPSFSVIVPDVVEAVRYARDHADDLDATFKAIEPAPHQQSIPMVPTDSPKLRPVQHEQPVPQVPIEEYESLFHPTSRRPNTPEYIYGGIHPSIKWRK